MANIIVVSAHPDDEVIGAGGTLLKHAQKGDKIYWLIITGLFEEYGFSKERIASRNEEIEKVAKMLNVEKTFRFDYPTMQLHSATVIDMVPKISAVFKEVDPEYIYTMNRSDAHSDHRIVFDAVAACTKSFRYPGIKRVLMYECISETEFAPALPEKMFLPNYFVDITRFIENKLEIMKVYASEIDEHPFPRSIENIKALAHFRGASVGVKYAEAFQLIKLIDKD
ncbi:PIG-L family deacetylase [Chitinophaga sp. YIM B06452]|uniref:PIG-L deacetylase family protein n=1 Tax=Chitinophaga sp. YIM B06452 TaxID=3082158 RepID=UPI0031FE6CC6